MKLVGVVSLLVLLHGANSEDLQSPVSKVVKLLENLSDKLEQELKDEEDVFEKYECWYKSIKDSKTSSTAAAQSRIASLNSYIEDIEGGQIEYTSERQDFQKQIKEIQSDIDTTEALREKEQQDYSAAREEIERAIDALDQAAEALKEGLTVFIQSRKPGHLRIRSQLQTALKLGRSLLGADDAKLLEAFANGEVIKPMEVGSEDWQKVNRKATFNNNYESRSDQLYNTMISMKNMFLNNLEHAEHKELENDKSYQALRTQKNDMLTEADTGLSTLVEENGARMKAKEEAGEEKDALTDQIAQDQSFIDQVEAAHATKEQEYNQRKAMRGNEITAIGKAISVLHSDTSRDSFRASYSQAHLASFLQLPCPQRRVIKSTLPQAHAALMAVASQDTRVLEIAKLLRQPASSYTLGNATLDPRHPANGITLVVRYIDQLIQNLMEEESSDLEQKNKCEDDFAATAQQARFQSLEVDEYSEGINRALSKIDDINKQIADEQASVDELKSQLAGLTEQRNNERAEFLKQQNEDQTAVDLIKKAMITLENWENAGQGPSEVAPALLQLGKPSSTKQVVASKKSLSLSTRTIHTKVNAHMDSVRAGVRPAPPPATWEEPEYTGDKSEADRSGILSILNLLKEDMEQDIRTAEEADGEAQQEFEKQKGALDASIEAGQNTIDGYEQDRAAQEEAKVRQTEGRQAKSTELADTVKSYQAMKPGCDFVLMNMEARYKKRTFEVDGLRKAKAILEGADMIAITPTTEYGGIRTGLLQKC